MALDRNYQNVVTTDEHGNIVQDITKTVNNKNQEFVDATIAKAKEEISNYNKEQKEEDNRRMISYYAARGFAGKEQDQPQNRDYTEYEWNVLSEDEFKDRVDGVFYKTAELVAKTLGPYGSQIVLDNFGETHITKDGHNIIKRLRFSDGDPALNAIFNIISEVAATVVGTVGDGSTSSIVLSHYLHNEITNSSILETLRLKDKQNILKKAVELVTSRIQENAIDIDKDGDLSEIYDLALVSTNGDEEIASMIQKIYKETKNPTIYIKEAVGSETTYDILEGYRVLISLTDAIYINSDDGSCDIRKPMLLLFNHKVGSDDAYVEFINEAYSIASNQGRRLVVAAPYYDKGFRDKMTYQIKKEIKEYGISNLVLCVASLSNNVLEHQYNDFAMLAGCSSVKYLDMERYHEKITYLKEIFDKKQKGEDVEVDDEKLTFDISEFLGEVGRISIGAKDATATDLYNKDKTMYEIHLKDAIKRYEDVRERNRRLNLIEVEETELKQRVAKLRGKIGSIFVGGSSSIERKSNYDLLDDAVRACESAYNYGYNIGGNLSIYKACDSLINEISESDNKDEFLLEVIKCISGASLSVYAKVLKNKYKDSDDLEEIQSIIYNTIKYGKMYDLVTDTYSDKIINSCRTDIEILKASMSIITSLFTSSVFVSLGTIHNPDSVTL